MEQMTIMLTKFERHDDETFQAQKEVFVECLWSKALIGLWIG